MKSIPTTLSLVALSALLAACGSKSTPAADSAPAAAPTSAAAADAGTASSGSATTASVAAPAADNVATIDGTKFADQKGDATAGEKIFQQCKACHVIDPGQNRVGPSLHGIIGRHSGIIPGFSYSNANKNSGIVWSKEKLYQYLEKPSRVVPGTKMAFAGLPKAQDRADVIAYLDSATK